MTSTWKKGGKGFSGIPTNWMGVVCIFMAIHYKEIELINLLLYSMKFSVKVTFEIVSFAVPMQTITLYYLMIPIHVPTSHVQYNKYLATWIEFHAHNFSKY